MSRLRSLSPGRAVLRRPVLAAVLLWLALVMPVLSLIWVAVGFARGGWDMALVAGGFAAVLALRRVLPLGALLITMTLATWSVTMFIGEGGWVPFLSVALGVLGYLVGRADSGEHPLWLQFLLAELVVAALMLLLGMTLQEVIMAALFLPVFVVFPWLWGRYHYQHAQLTAGGWRRAQQLEHDQVAAAEQAKLRERTRIAEDMHDSLGHELSLIAVRAAALEVDNSLSQDHREAAGQLRRSAATATERLREIIGVLRADENSSSVTPVDENVRALIDRAVASGMDITARTPGGDGQLPPMVDRAVYRVVQESLTNAAKHATGQPVGVEITHQIEHITVTVSNPLPEPESTGGAGGGRGLLGLSERVRLAGGNLRYGIEDARFRLVARLPHSGAESIADETESSESVRQMGAQRRRARARLVVAIAAPAVTLTLLAAPAGGWWWLSQHYSDVDPRVYHAIAEGQSRGEVERHLPLVEMLDPPTQLSHQAHQPDVDCQYYRGPAGTRGLEDVYELCFDRDVLATKDVITAEERYREVEDSNSR